MLGIKKLSVVSAGIVLSIVGTVNSAFAASVGYITASEPWGNTTNDAALNTAFGASNWDKLDFVSALPTIFNPGAYHVLFIEGSDSNGDSFRTFIDNNRTTLQTWVSNGGKLLLNAARNNGFGDLDLGFGVNLHNNFYDTASYTGTAVNPSHPIFSGPNGVTGTSFSGNYFAHDTVSGSGLKSIIDGTAGSVLAELNYGSGRALFGGLTTPNFHSPQPEATILRANILSYVASPVSPSSVPEPLTILGSGVALGFGSLMRKKYSKKLQSTAENVG
ncbi:PEP-CTERM sorting domain-containing protein [Nostoc sp. 106C]|uniref:PEP-CTERM sorting domain-containing protein n=1 Tax=Nostoc sp. 106C TaxID=1932667 RepID=UPI000A39AA41|nr:PEP-CTERM sorting domain-containing protein [Nostoc sp. 106C]OUL35245.1 hypothetical protein BV375_02080 [Nostoc sp. 106C]